MTESWFVHPVAVLYLPMDLDAFAEITGAIAKHFPDAKLGEPDSEGQVLIERHIPAGDRRSTDGGSDG